jgi:hypothetical protein
MFYHVFLSLCSADKPAVEELACRFAKEIQLRHLGYFDTTTT